MQFLRDRITKTLSNLVSWNFVGVINSKFLFLGGLVFTKRKEGYYTITKQEELHYVLEATYETKNVKTNGISAD